jgi:4-diphosphocytidyl-2-C-methyl-D-erythritol kinase
VLSYSSVPVDRCKVFSPAKLNLFLAITGRRDDGFHNLVSLVAPLDFGDTLWLAPAAAGEHVLECDRTDLAVDDSNLVCRAVQAFRVRSGWSGGVRIQLEKRIPIGAGLGGGSSNAAVTLQALNQLAGSPLSATELQSLAAGLGSDCPLFLRDGPVVLRGRGEQLSDVPAKAAEKVVGRRVLIFKPAFGIATAWAYRTLADAASRGEPSYLSEAEASGRVAAWLEDDRPLEDLLYNNMEQAAFSKFVALPTLLEKLRREHGWTARMSGSGSACFGLLANDQPAEPLIRCIKAAWGDSAFCQIAQLRQGKLSKSELTLPAAGTLS